MIQYQAKNRSYAQEMMPAFGRAPAGFRPSIIVWWTHLEQECLLSVAERGKAFRKTPGVQCPGQRGLD
jgi:hypothetical protein